MWSWLTLAAAATLAQASSSPTVTEALRSSRSTLVLSSVGLTGTGASTLSALVAKARIVAVGEDHATWEIPALVSRLCRDNAGSLTGLALESAPRATAAIRPLLSDPDREKRMRDFVGRYPDAVAFLDIRADNDMAAACVSAQPRLKVFGIDQEFLGSAGFLIDQMLTEHLSPAARSAILKLKGAELERQTKARASGNPADLLLIGGSDGELAEAEAALKEGGSRRARSIMADLLESRRIFRTDGNASNQLRASLLKRNIAREIPASGKVFIKLGDWHLYRGYNPLNNRDVGNWVAEHADSEGTSSLHILVLGAAGVHALYNGYGKPWRREAFKMSYDRDYRWLGAATDAMSGMAPTEWAMFDLRPLRDRQLAGMDVPWRRVLDGYDLLILIPELTPSDSFSSAIQR